MQEIFNAALPPAQWPLPPNNPLAGTSRLPQDYNTPWPDPVAGNAPDAPSTQLWGSIVYTRPKPGGGAGEYQFGISSLTKVYYGDSTATYLSPTGVLGDLPPKPGSTGWVDIVSGDLSWIEVTNGSSASWATPTGAAVKYAGSGDDFGSSYYESDGGTGSPAYYTQTKLKVPIGRFWVNADNSLNVELMPGRSVFLVVTGADAYESGGGGPHSIAVLTWV